jgi:hypothetical protein
MEQISSVANAVGTSVFLVCGLITLASAIASSFLVGGLAAVLLSLCYAVLTVVLLRLAMLTGLGMTETFL